MTELTFTQLLSSVNPSFWNKFTELKLNVDKLEETQHHIFGYLSSVICNETHTATIVEVDSTSFNQNFDGQNIYLPFHGKLLNKNTIDSFKECDKVKLINDAGEMLYEKIKNGDALHDPSFLNWFMILSFADLKKYHYYYWFAFPVPKNMIIENTSTTLITNEFSDNELQQLYKAFRKLDFAQRTFFLAEKSELEVMIHSLESKMKDIQEDDIKNIYFVFYNIANNAEAVRSQLKNYIALIIHYCKFLQNNCANFIALTLSRERSQVTCRQSYIYRLKLPKAENITWVGWEKNERDKMGPRLANMKNTLDPYVIAENSVDLNLKLMKWRVLPEINLDKIKNTKCLLLGAGTLGCSVARTLLAWGVRNITFVDNSTVSFSNPVRQSLFTYLDSVQMKPKSVAAAEGLKTIFPGVNSRGFQFTIPMPGHSVGDSLLERTKENVELLIKLISDHDIIFLLMDSRESRWLPTLLANALNKITINAALGFDTYLVMRHGIRNGDKTVLEFENNPAGFKCIPGTELGCYFCNDVTAPGNSTKDRTLDQQCTVTRPGVSQIAGALAVELAISILLHKQGTGAPAFYKTSQNSEGDITDTQNQSLLGLIPHSIRGFLSSFEHILPATQKYQHCVACSDVVLNEYRENGFDFLLKVFNSSKHLEDITHLTEIFKETDFGDVLEFSDDGDFL